MHNARWWLGAALVAVLIFASCRGDANPTPTPVAPTSTAPAPTVPPAPVMTPTPTVTSAMSALLLPGPTMPNLGQFFFLNQSDLWQAQSGGRIVHVTRNLVLGPWVMAPDGTRAMTVIYSKRGEVTTEEVRIVRGDGILSVPLYGPAPTAGPDAASPIVALSWSWDQTKLAVAFADGSIGVLQVPADEDQYPVAVERIVRAGADPAGRAIAWAPGGSGVAFLTAAGDARGMFIAPLGAPAQIIIGDIPIQTFTWLPGRGRIAFVQQAIGGGRDVPGSIFTVAADGTALELLLSSGQFAPAAEVLSLSASPDGRSLAFTVFAPGNRGDLQFQSLWMLTIDGAELTHIPVAVGYRVADMWWTTQGLTWRAVSVGAPAGDDPTVYTGTGAFILQRYDDATKKSTSLFSAASR